MKLAESYDLPSVTMTPHLITKQKLSTVNEGASNEDLLDIEQNHEEHPAVKRLTDSLLSSKKTR